MRLAYCIHALNLSGGIERVLTTKANYLADVMGYEIHIITARQKGRKEFFPLSGKIIRHDLDANDRMFLIKYRKRLDALLAKIRPDITVTVCDNSLYALTRCTDGSVKIGEFHFSHEKFLMKYGTNAIGKLYASFRTRKLENAVRKLDRFVVLTKADKNDWRKVTPEVEQIYNPLPFVSDEVSHLDEKRCIAAGRLESQKNFKDLITAWKTVDARHPDWKLSVYGDGSQKESLQDQIDSMGLKGKVTLKGRTNDVRKELLGSSCLVMSSRFEGFPMILLEALATGLPIVSYDCPKGPSEIVTIGANGYLAKVGDTGTLAQGICSVIANEELRKRFGAESKRRSENFTLEKTMEKWDALFKSALKRKTSLLVN
mgnify:FL=1|jgi:glycosyltransferase involved in cell wall biosynthesis